MPRKTQQLTHQVQQALHDRAIRIEAGGGQSAGIELYSHLPRLAADDAQVGDRIEGRKLAGLLIDAHGSKAERLVVGVGVNVGRAEFDEGLPAASFRTAGYADVSRTSVVTALARELDRAVQMLASMDAESAPDELLDESLGGLGSVFVDRLGLVGRSARIELIDGRALTAEVSDLDPRTCWLSDGTAIPLAEIERARAE